MMPGRSIESFIERSGRSVPALGLELGDLSGQTVLDLCAGSGTYVAHLLERGASRVTWLDREPRLLEAARERFGADERVDFELRELSALGAFEGRFDGCLFREALYHAPDEAWTLQQIARLVRPGGWLCVSIPTHRRYRGQVRLVDQALRVALKAAGGPSLRPGFASRRLTRRRLAAAGFQLTRSASYGVAETYLCLRA